MLLSQSRHTFPFHVRVKCQQSHMADILSWIIGTRRAIGHSLQNDENGVSITVPGK